MKIAWKISHDCDKFISFFLQEGNVLSYSQKELQNSRMMDLKGALNSSDSVVFKPFWESKPLLKWKWASWEILTCKVGKVKLLWLKEKWGYLEPACLASHPLHCMSPMFGDSKSPLEHKPSAEEGFRNHRSQENEKTSHRLGEVFVKRHIQ